MLSKSCGYAIRGILYVALKEPEGRKIGIQEIATALEAPAYFMGKIMQGLVRRDMISSTKGPNGGFYLNDATLDIPVINVVDAIDGMIRFRRCALNLPNCSNAHPCPLHVELTGLPRSPVPHTVPPYHPGSAHRPSSRSYTTAGNRTIIMIDVWLVRTLLFWGRLTKTIRSIDAAPVFSHR